MLPLHLSIPKVIYIEREHISMHILCVKFFCVFKYVYVKFSKPFENHGFVLINWMTSFSPFFLSQLVFSQMIIVFIIFSFYKCVVI
jgi:hypothetical protein